MDLKEWTDELLSMVERHDKEVTGLRKRNKYLHTIDDKFFSFGVFNSDHL